MGTPETECPISRVGTLERGDIKKGDFPVPEWENQTRVTPSNRIKKFFYRWREGIGLLPCVRSPMLLITAADGGAHLAH